ncbi:hypothetical protein MMUR_22190 [Mycolicibacterium murale]|uniref:Uncharacterized protein n=1 Tax=Mycolicibacterium murale TaxID=182220 RepID=A0A7I9WKA5_9MYCO|nr:hypothetical protein [Mycolicibacterium murale]MCV7185580.1 hypothetical protein [Mycolicibacterium murale]GFG58083.1 hypothetical protein MMUR_22190 [Mycolicibacterium murale]
MLTAETPRRIDPSGCLRPARDQTEDTGGPIAEARRYRRRAQAAEAERDELRSQLDVLTSQLTAIRQAEVDNIARAEGLRNPALLSAEHPLESLITDEGTVDREAVTAAVHAFMDDNGIPRRLPGIQPNPGFGFKTGNGGGRPAGTWKGAIDGARNG